MLAGQISKDIEKGGLRLEPSFMPYLGYELAKEGLGEAVMGYPGLGHWLEDLFPFVARYFNSMGEYSLVFAEGDGVCLHSRVNLDCYGPCSLFGH